MMKTFIDLIQTIDQVSKKNREDDLEELDET